MCVCISHFRSGASHGLLFFFLCRRVFIFGAPSGGGRGDSCTSVGMVDSVCLGFLFSFHILLLSIVICSMNMFNGDRWMTARQAEKRQDVCSSLAFLLVYHSVFLLILLFLLSKRRVIKSVQIHHNKDKDTRCHNDNNIKH